MRMRLNINGLCSIRYSTSVMAICNVTETFSNSDLQLHYGTELTDGVSVSGKYGELITWTLEKNVLKIEGTGEIKYNNNFPCYPWYYYDSYVMGVLLYKIWV